MRALVLVAIALTGCGAPAVETAPPGAAQERAAINGCPATAAREWRSEGGALEISASAQGASCAGARATITIRDARGATFLTESFAARDVTILAGAESTGDMERRLNEWISPPGAAANSVGDLPAWREGALQPGDGFQTFAPAAGLDRARYEALRTRDAGMVCFEALEGRAHCIAVENGAPVRLGALSFLD